MRSALKFLLLLSMACAFSACAVLHHVQVGHIDNQNKSAAIPFEILMSEMGVSAEEVGKLSRASNSRGGDDVAGLAGLVALFQVGPRTGKPIYNPRYAEKLVYEIHQKCPTGRVTGLVSVREMRDYPAISGEIVKVTGYCLKDRVAAPKVGHVDYFEGEL